MGDNGQRERRHRKGKTKGKEQWDMTTKETRQTIRGGTESIIKTNEKREQIKIGTDLKWQGASARAYSTTDTMPVGYTLVRVEQAADVIPLTYRLGEHDLIPIQWMYWRRKQRPTRFGRDLRPIRASSGMI